MLLNTLADLAVDGFIAGESVIVIATENHLEELKDKLLLRGFGLDAMIDDNKFILLDADLTFSKFMVNRFPSEKYFMETLTAVMKRAPKNGRKVRVNSFYNNSNLINLIQPNQPKTNKYAFQFFPAGHLCQMALLKNHRPRLPLQNVQCPCWPRSKQ